jgi:hypothetical protein
MDLWWNIETKRTLTYNPSKPLEGCSNVDEQTDYISLLEDVSHVFTSGKQMEEVLHALIEIESVPELVCVANLVKTLIQREKEKHSPCKLRHLVIHEPTNADPVMTGFRGKRKECERDQLSHPLSRGFNNDLELHSKIDQANLSNVSKYKIKGKVDSEKKPKSLRNTSEESVEENAFVGKTIRSYTSRNLMSQNSEPLTTTKILNPFLFSRLYSDEERSRTRRNIASI